MGGSLTKAHGFRCARAMCSGEQNFAAQYNIRVYWRDRLCRCQELTHSHRNHLMQVPRSRQQRSLRSRYPKPRRRRREAAASEGRHLRPAVAGKPPENAIGTPLSPTKTGSASAAEVHRTLKYGCRGARAHPSNPPTHTRPEIRNFRSEICVRNVNARICPLAYPQVQSGSKPPERIILRSISQAEESTCVNFPIPPGRKPAAF